MSTATGLPWWTLRFLWRSVLPSGRLDVFALQSNLPRWRGHRLTRGIQVNCERDDYECDGTEILCSACAENKRAAERRRIDADISRKESYYAAFVNESGDDIIF